MSLATQEQTLAILCGPGVVRTTDGLYTISCWGRVIEELASRYAKVNLCVPVLGQRDRRHDFCLPRNVALFALPSAETALRRCICTVTFRRVMVQAVRSADAVFVRDALTPAVGHLYREVQRQHKPLLHWLVGNPMQLLRSHRRGGVLKDNIGKLFVWWWERRFRKVHARSTLAGIVSFGREIANRFPSGRNYVLIGSPVRCAEIRCNRTDTCMGKDRVRIMCACYVRPEKGIEYLLGAFSQLRASGNTELVIVGARDRYPRYQRTLDDACRHLNIQHRVTWVGHATNAEMEKLFASADIFAFPSLSEGAPYVLVEARAHGVPVVSTDVGGIPDSITHGWDGLLVPSKSPNAMAKAIDAVIADTSLRQRLIANGYQSAGGLCVERFVDNIIGSFATLARHGGAAC